VLAVTEAATQPTLESLRSRRAGWQRSNAARKESCLARELHNDWNGGTIDWSNEAIASPCKRLDEDGRFRRFAQRIAQSLDRGIQAVIKVDECVCRPKPATQFLSSNNFPGCSSSAANT